MENTPNTPSQITPEQFKVMLDKFDWNYAYTDDHSVYMRESARRDELKAIASETSELTAIWNAKIATLK